MLQAWKGVGDWEKEKRKEDLGEGDSFSLSRFSPSSTFPPLPYFAPTTQATTHPKSITFNVKSGSRPSSPSKGSPSSATNQADGKKKKSSSKVDEDRRTRER